MRIIKIRYQFFFLLFLISCQQFDDPSFRNIKFTQGNEEIITDRFKIEFIQLETTENSIISITSQVEFFEDFIFVLDGNPPNGRIMVFDLNGKYIKQIGNQGKGPGEYLMPAVMFLNVEKDEISVYDMEIKKVLYYSLTDFTFKYEQSIPFGGVNMTALSDGNLAWYCSLVPEDYYILITDENLNILNHLVDQEFSSGYSWQGGGAYQTFRKIYAFENKVYFMDPFKPYLYHITSQSADPRLSISFDKFKLASIKQLKKWESQDPHKNYLHKLRTSGHISYYQIFETHEYICIIFNVNDNDYFGFYDKTKEEAVYYPVDQLASKLKLGFFPSTLIGVKGDHFVSYLYLPLYWPLLETEYEFNPEMIRYLEASKEDDNPILVLLTVR